MSLYQRSGIWHFDFTLDGKRVRGSTKQRDESKARIFESEQMMKARSQGVKSVTFKPQTLEEYSREFLAWVTNTQTLTHDTRRTYKNGVRLLLNTALAGMKLTAITNHECETIKFPGSASNANQALRTLRRMFSKAKEMKLFFGELPEIQLRKEWPRSIAMTEENSQSIADSMDKGDPRDAFDILRTAAPMRPRECFTMRWEFMHLAEAFYQNPRGKSASAQRPILLLGESLQVLKRRHLEQGSPTQGWVFPSARAKSGRMETITKAFNKARDKAGLPKGMVLYTSRHGRATDIAPHVSTKELMDMGGWSDTKTCMRYQHPDVSKLEAKLAAARTTGAIN